MRMNLLAASLLAALAGPSLAATAPKTASPEDRLAALEARIQALETEAARLRAEAASAIASARAAQAEAKQTSASLASAQTQAVAAPAEANAAGANGNAFNPAISLILNGSYAHHSADSAAYALDGFTTVGEAGPMEDGLALGESELSFAANIDDQFYGQMTLAFGSEDGEVETAIEEAYIDSTALPEGFTLRAGRFFSNIGYLNSHHAHADAFSDRPLAYQAFLGNQYGDDGLQLRWVAPTELFVELGGEALRGANFPSGGAGHGGIGARSLFAHLGGDLGDEHSWLAGLSVLDSDTRGAEDGFFGDNRLYVADLTWKWAPNGNTKDGGISFRAELMREERDGQYANAENPSLDQTWEGRRSGGYAELIHRLNRRWDLGYRYDKLRADDTGPLASDFDPYRHSLELSWHNSEFALIRLQYSHGVFSHGESSRDPAGAYRDDNTISLQYQVSLGAHGAHKF